MEPCSQINLHRDMVAATAEMELTHSTIANQPFAKQSGLSECTLLKKTELD